jgi:hypothetical protein
MDASAWFETARAARLLAMTDILDGILKPSSS